MYLIPLRIHSKHANEYDDSTYFFNFFILKLITVKSSLFEPMSDIDWTTSQDSALQTGYGLKIIIAFLQFNNIKKSNQRNHIT